jgi:hypothetical protein
MNTARNVTPAKTTQALTNGSGAAAILAAGAGCFALGALTVAGEVSAPVKSGLIFYLPTGALSGVTTVAILIWLAVWGTLEWRWQNKTVRFGPVNAVALALLALGLLLTFPPVVDLF